MKVAIVGAGVVGRNLARALQDRGDQVLVLSPRPVELGETPFLGLWRRCDVLTGEGLRGSLGGVDAVVQATAAPKGPAAEALAREGTRNVAVAAARADVARLVLVGPAGAGRSRKATSLASWPQGVALARQQGPTNVVEVRLPVLFGDDDHLAGQWVRTARSIRSLTVRAARTEVAALWVGDAMQLLLLAIDGALPRATVAVQGPQTDTIDALARAVQERFGVGRAVLRNPLYGRPEDLARLKEQLEDDDDWEELGLPPRRTFVDWLAAQ